MPSVGKCVVVSDVLKDAFVELKIMMTVSHGSRFFALSIGYTTVKKRHIARIWSPEILRIRSAYGLPFLECLANPLDLWNRSPSPLQIFLTCSFPKPIAFVLPQWTLRRRSFLQQHQLLSTFVRFSSPTCVQYCQLLLLPTEASENHSQSCICSYFHLHCPCICLLQE